MVGEWPALSLSEAGVSLIDCEHRTPPASDSGYPYIAIPQIKHGRIDLGEVRRISRKHFVEWTRKAKPEPYDVILSRRCNPGETAFVPLGLECALGQNLVLLRADGTMVFKQFLRWLVRGPDWWEQIGRFINVGAVFDSLKCADIPDFRLPISPLPEQRAIAHILGTLDDKIELNRRMNETLEAIARAIFKSWFVDFDPVRAKMAGRQPHGMDAATAALFPDAFEDSLLGKIPKGWRAGPFTEEIEVVGGGTPKTAVPEYWDGDIPWFSVVDAPDNGSIWVWDTEKHITRLGLEKSSTKMLAKGTTIISARGTVGKCALVGRPMAMNQSCYGIQAASRRGAYYTHFAVRHEIANLQQNSHGSVFDTITTSTFAGIDRVVPPANVTQFFDRTVSPFLERALASLLESSSLAAIRDALLPKLLSGQVRVKDAEKLVEADA
jgi:type I restriction enzyme S subunit